MKKLDVVTQDRRNNLNIIRFIAAILVVYSHAYPLGNGGLDPLGRITQSQIHFGNLAVCVFFFYGGFLISKSVNRQPDAKKFFKARCLRIFPCLWVVVLLSAVVLGAVVSSVPAGLYFTEGGTWKYLLNGVFLLQHNLPGVFEGNVAGTAVNGSLWTLPVEFVCYIVCFVAYKLGLLQEKRLKYTIPFFVIGYLIAWKLLSGIPVIQTALRPCGMFYMGMLFYTYRHRITLKLSMVILSIAGLVVGTWLHILEFTIFFFLPYLLACLAFGTERKLDSFGRKTEMSYGIYLCAFPIQQTVTMLWGGSMEPLLNFVISMPFILIGGYLLCIGIEHPIARWEMRRKQSSIA